VQVGRRERLAGERDSALHGNDLSVAEDGRASHFEDGVGAVTSPPPPLSARFDDESLQSDPAGVGRRFHVFRVFIGVVEGIDGVDGVEEIEGLEGADGADGADGLRTRLGWRSSRHPEESDRNCDESG